MRAAGQRLLDWQVEPCHGMVERIRQLDVDQLQSVAIPDGQYHLSFGPDIDPLLKTAAEVIATPEAATAFGVEVHGWVRWDRKVGYGMAAAFTAVTAGGHLEPWSRALLATAQTAYNHDTAVVNLDTAYGLLLQHDPERTVKPIWALVDMLTIARVNYVGEFLKPRPYSDFSPVAAHPYADVTFGWLALEHSEALGEGDQVDTGALATFIDQAVEEGDEYSEVVAGRILGDVLGARGDPSGSLAARYRALNTAVACEMTTEIGHLRRTVGSQLISEGLAQRRASDSDAATESFRAAATELEAAVEFEAEPGCEYWAALAHYRLGDAHRYYDDLAEDRPPHERALRSYARGRDLLSVHLSQQIVPADRAVKRQIFASFSATALRTAFALEKPHELLAHIAADGSSTAADLELELRALRGLDDGMRASFAQTRGVYHLEMTTIERGLEAYEELVRESHHERLRYYVGKLWTDRRPHVAAETLVQRVAAELPEGVRVLTMDPCQFDTYAAAFDRASAHVRFANTREVTEPDISAAQAEFARAVGIAKNSTAGAQVVMTALDALLQAAPQALAHLVDTAFSGATHVERLVLLPYRQLSSFPWHALEVGGAPLLERCEVVYGHSFEMLEILQERPLTGGEANRTTMLYDDAGADFFEPLAAAGREIGIEQVLRNPPWEDVEALAPLGPRVAPEDSDPLFGHVLIHAPLPDDAAPPSAPEPTPRAAAQDLFFACHGEFDPQDPLSSGLLFDDQSRTVNFADILSKLDLGAWRGVVLGACETGLARRELATEQVSIGSAFLAAGVDHVVSTLWPVDRLATAILLHHFFERLLTGHGYPTALREACLALRAMPAEALIAWAHDRLPDRYQGVARRRAEASQRPFAHPYFWAGFIVAGRP